MTTRTGTPLIGAGVSTLAASREAADEVLARALPGLSGASPDLAVVFASMHHAVALPALLARLTEALPDAAVFGCTAEGVLGTGVEVEDAPGVALWLARLPGVRVEPVHLRFRPMGDEGIVEGLGLDGREGSVLLLLADPFSFPTDSFIEHLNGAVPGMPVVGGIASGGTRRGQNKLFFGPAVIGEGAVGAVLSGDVSVATVVSQGCRPVGPLLRVTAAQGNSVRELDGEPAMRRLERVYEEAEERDRELMAGGIHIGVAVEGRTSEPGAGEFVIRGVLGTDPESGAIVIGDLVDEGRLVRFHVRDAESAREDLRLLLEAERLLLPEPPAGALLFSCNGRGQRLFGAPHQDVGIFARTFGPVPVAGFFAQGELGPVGGRNLLHGFTASVALFLAPQRADG